MASVNLVIEASGGPSGSLHFHRQGKIVKRAQKPIEESLNARSLIQSPKEFWLQRGSKNQDTEYRPRSDFARPKDDRWRKPHWRGARKPFANPERLKLPGLEMTKNRNTPHDGTRAGRQARSERCARRIRHDVETAGRSVPESRKIDQAWSAHRNISPLRRSSIAQRADGMLACSVALELLMREQDMQLNNEVGFGVDGDKVQARYQDDQLSRALRLPPAVRQQLIEQLRKADRPVLATPVVP